MRLFKIFICALFFIAAVISPAAALPYCVKMAGMSKQSDNAVSSHCKEMQDSSAEVQTNKLSDLYEPDATPHGSTVNKKGCCCDGDTGGACKANCKTLVVNATLTDVIKPLLFENSFDRTINIQFGAFVFEIITPPPKTCA